MSPEERQKIDETINRYLIRYLLIVAFCLMVLFIGYAIAQEFFLNEQHSRTMVIYALSCSLLLYLIVLCAYFRLIPKSWATNTYVLMSWLILSSDLLRLYLTNDPKHTAHLVLFIVGAGVIFASTRIFLFLTSFALGGWIVWLFSLDNWFVESDFVFYLLYLIAGVLAAGILHWVISNIQVQLIKANENLDALFEQDIQDEKLPAGKVVFPKETLSDLYALIEERFSLQELRELCFLTGVEFENLIGENRASKLQELILHLNRLGDLPKLVHHVISKRPSLRNSIMRLTRGADVKFDR